MLDRKLEELLEKQLPNKQSVSEHLEEVKIDSNKTNITREQLIDVLANISADGAYLSKPDIQRVLIGFDFPLELSEKENADFEGIWRSRKRGHRNKLHSVIESKKDAELEQLERNIKSLKAELNEISIKSSPEIVQLRESVDKIVDQSRKVAAPIKMPSPKNMEVQLVSADSLHRLSEYNSDINILLTLSAVFLGAFLGMLGNLVFSSNISNQAYGVIVILAVVSILFFSLYYRADQRKKNLSNDMLNDDDGVYIDDYKA